MFLVPVPTAAQPAAGTKPGAPCTESAQSNHLSLAPGSTSCSLGRALLQALQTELSVGVYRPLRNLGASHSCLWNLGFTWPASPRDNTPELWQMPDGQGQTPCGPPSIGGSQGLTHDKHKLSKFGKLAFYAAFQLQFQECPSVTNKVLHTGNGNSFISINVLGFYLGQQEGPAHLSNSQGRTAGASPHD